MTRFDRYLLSQLLWLFGFFALVLVLVYWVNRAVSLFDRLIANGHSALVFLEFTALTLPNVIRLVLPVAAFAATVYVTNRLTSESELVAAQATGYSPVRLARTVALFGVIVAVLVSVLAHVLVPAATARFLQRSAEISQNATARLLTEGEFLYPTPGVTFYVREITPEGELRDIFLSDARHPERTLTYTATGAVLVRRDSGPKLVMFEGMVQLWRPDSQRLTVTRFRDFSVDVGELIDRSTPARASLSVLGTRALLQTPAVSALRTGSTVAAARQAGHARVTQALKAIVVSLVGFSMLLVGGFSRFGLWRQILGAIVAVVVLEALDNSLSSLVRKGELPWPALYAPALCGLTLAALLLYLASRARRAVRGVPA